MYKIIERFLSFFRPLTSEELSLRGYILDSYDGHIRAETDSELRTRIRQEQ